MNTDKSEWIDIQNIYTYNEFTNEQISNLFVIESIENSGNFSNDSYVEVGSAKSNFVLSNPVYQSLAVGLQVTPIGNILNTGCFTVYNDMVIEGTYEGSLLNYGTITGNGTYTYNRDTGGSGIPLQAEKDNTADRFILHFNEFPKGIEERGFIIYSRQNNFTLKTRTTSRATSASLICLGNRKPLKRWTKILTGYPSMPREASILYRSIHRNPLSVKKCFAGSQLAEISYYRKV